MPGWRLRHALMEAAARGVRVALARCRAGRTTACFQHCEPRRSTARCSTDGIEIYEYERERPARQGRGRRRALGDGGLVEHRSRTQLLMLAWEANLFVADDLAFAEDLRVEPAADDPDRRPARPDRSIGRRARPCQGAVVGRVRRGARGDGFPRLRWRRVVARAPAQARHSRR
ncbi:MAG: hypothetical protein MZW92_67575 [Comamonadaceae bacterium]|nr:hypothetical protein [Comamonadaceae bacterium]